MYESAAGVKLQILLGEVFSLGFGQRVGTLQAGMTRACRAQTKVASLVRDVFPLAALARSVHPNDFIERKCFLLESPFLKMAAVGFSFSLLAARATAGGGSSMGSTDRAMVGGIAGSHIYALDGAGACSSRVSHSPRGLLPSPVIRWGEVLRRNRSGPDVSRAYPLLDESSVTTKSP